MGQYFTLAGLLYLLQNALTQLTPVNFQGTTTNGSPTVGNLSSQTGLAVGQIIVGVGIPSGTTILAINSGANTLTLSANATATTTTSAETQMWAFGTATQQEGLTVHLLQGNIPQSPETSWSQLTEASYDGYLPQAATGPFVFSVNGGQYANASPQLMTFTPTDYLVPQTITGLAWTYTVPGASGPTLVATEQFATPVNLSEQGDLIRVVPVLTLNPDELSFVPSPMLS